MRAEEYSTRIQELDGWKVRLTSYRLGNTYHCTADNVDPGAWIARAQGATDCLRDLIRAWMPLRPGHSGCWLGCAVPPRASGELGRSLDCPARA